MSTEAATHAVEHSAKFDMAEMLTHHMVNSQELEMPWGTIHLPTLDLFGYQLPVTRHAVMMWVASSLALIIMVWIAQRARLVPGKAQSLLEMVVVFIRDEVAIKNMGEEDGRRWTPFLLTTFFFIFFCNILGMVPFAASATANISVTGAMALLTLVLIHGSGIARFGIIGHWKNYLPPGLPGWMSFALCMRLFANMLAGHMIVLSFLGLIFVIGYVFVPVSVGLALFIGFLELLVIPLQAYIFTMLTSLFIGMSLHPAH